MASKKSNILTLVSKSGIVSSVVSGIVNKSITIPEGFTITAHTGCEGTKDNSLDSITVAAVSGADVVEFDLFIADNNSVLSHDEPVGGEVSFEDAISHAEKFDKLMINIDVKKADDLSDVALIIEKYGISDRVFFTGIDVEKVQIVKDSAAGIKFYLNSEVDISKATDVDYLNELVLQVTNAGACGINIKYSQCTQKLVEIFHENELKVSLWTVNNRFDMKKILKFGADNITTKKPTEYRKIINEILG